VFSAGYYAFVRADRGKRLAPEQRFKHRLALALGRTIAEMEHTMGAGEYADWVEYYAAEPWGAYRDNLHTGIIASVIANVHRGKKGKAVKPADFLLRSRDDQRQSDTKQSLSYLRAVGVRKHGRSR